MITDEREIKCNQRILKRAEGSGNVAKTCRYFGIPRSLVLCVEKSGQLLGKLVWPLCGRNSLAAPFEI